MEVGAAYDETQALDILTAFVTANTVRTYDEFTAMGTDGSDGGPLEETHLYVHT